MNERSCVESEYWLSVEVEVSVALMLAREVVCVPYPADEKPVELELKIDVEELKVCPKEPVPFKVRVDELDGFVMSVGEGCA